MAARSLTIINTTDSQNKTAEIVFTGLFFRLARVLQTDLLRILKTPKPEVPMPEFYEGCFLCALAEDLLIPERCFDCACPEIIRQNWMHSLGWYFTRFQREYQNSKWSRAISLAKRNSFPLISTFSRILSFYLSRRLSYLRPCYVTNVPAYYSATGLFPECSSFTARLLLDSVAGLTQDAGWIFTGDLFVQTREKTIKQHCCRSDAERKRNISNLYVLSNPHMVKDTNVILIDDVVTSGATLNECARVLYEAKARSVTALTLAKTARKTKPISTLQGGAYVLER